jgi:fermentation-respiration switch protein FrsA (DUF1100 family)
MQKLRRLPRRTFAPSLAGSNYVGYCIAIPAVPCCGFVGNIVRMPAADAATETKPPTPKKSRFRRWSKRLLRVAAIIYLVACLVVMLIQNWIIFPGAYFQDRAAAQVQPSPDRELLTLHTADGHRIAAIFGSALDRDGLQLPDAAARPTILFFYGNGDCIRTSLGPFENFRRLGANVLIPEYVGYPMSSGHPSESGVYATADAAYAYLLTRHDVDPKKIVVVGRSLGGAPAIDLASRERVAGLASFSAFTTMDAMARKTMPIFPTPLFLKAHFNNRQKIAQVKCPIWLAHGDQDTFVPYSMMADLAAEAHAPVTTYAIRGADHNSIFDVNDGSLITEFGAYLDSLHLAPSPHP